jgi:hypothetical protein
MMEVTGPASVVVGTKTVPLSVWIGEVTSGVRIVVGGKTTTGRLGGIIETIGGFGTKTSPGASRSSYVQVGGGNGTAFVGGARRVGVDMGLWVVGPMGGIWVLGILVL